MKPFGNYGNLNDPELDYEVSNSSRARVANPSLIKSVFTSSQKPALGGPEPVLSANMDLINLINLIKGFRGGGPGRGFELVAAGAGQGLWNSEARADSREEISHRIRI